MDASGGEGEPGVREVKAVGSFTLSDLTLAVYTSAWLGFTLQISLVLEESGTPRQCGQVGWSTRKWEGGKTPESRRLF